MAAAEAIVVPIQVDPRLMRMDRITKPENGDYARRPHNWLQVVVFPNCTPPAKSLRLYL